MSPGTATLPSPVSFSAAALPQSALVAAIPRLRRYARVLTRNPTRADDLVQDTLLRAWDKRRLWQVGTDLRAWLFTIMHNVHQNQRALARREAETSRSTPKANAGRPGKWRNTAINSNASSCGRWWN